MGYPKVDIDPGRLRELCAHNPPLSWDEIAREFGVTETPVRRAAALLGIVKKPRLVGRTRAMTYGPGGKKLKKHEPIPSTRRRCTDCGGIREAGTPHDCQPAEPYSRGLLYEFNRQDLTDRDDLVVRTTENGKRE